MQEPRERGQDPYMPARKDVHQKVEGPSTLLQDLSSLKPSDFKFEQENPLRTRVTLACSLFPWLPTQAAAATHGKSGALTIAFLECLKVSTDPMSDRSVAPPCAGCVVSRCAAGTLILTPICGLEHITYGEWMAAMEDINRGYLTSFWPKLIWLPFVLSLVRCRTASP